ncbi:MAG: trimeric intracellular cation channel family protein [Actinomycetota bacterium]
MKRIAPGLAEGDNGTVLVAFDLLGTFAFALSGVVLARRSHLDLFGAFVLSFAAGTAGGLARDVLLGATPPLALTDWRYPAVALVATALGYLWPALLDRFGRPITMLDAAGLGLFAVTGTWRALDLGAPAPTALALGVLTGVGGGVARDLLVARIPVVLRREVYALAAAVGSALVIIANEVEVERAFAGTVAVIVTCGLRLVAAFRNWHLPDVGGRDQRHVT